MELREITPNIFYIPDVVNLGVIRFKENSVILIDTGIDSSTGKKILNLLERENLVLDVIINTHSHADHCGGNKFLQEKTNVITYAPEYEETIIRNPYMEPWYLYSGAAPITDLQNKFLMAKPSQVDRIIKNNEKSLKFDNIEINIIPLPGHALNQIGIEVNSVCFCADSIFSKKIIEKHKVLFFMDLEKTLDTLNFLQTSKFSFYIPSHATPDSDLSKVIEENIESIQQTEELIFNELSDVKTTNQIIKGISDHYQISLAQVNQYFLMKTPILAYLSYLRNQNKIQVELNLNELYWNKVKN